MHEAQKHSKNIIHQYIIFILNLLFSYVFILQWPLCVTEFHESSWEFWVCRWVSYPLSQAEALRLLKQAEIQEINAKDGRTYVRQSWIPRLVKHLRCCTVIKIKHIIWLQVLALAPLCPWQDVDGLSLLDHAAIAGMRMLCTALLWHADFEHFESTGVAWRQLSPWGP